MRYLKYPAAVCAVLLSLSGCGGGDGLITGGSVSVTPDSQTIVVGAQANFVVSISRASNSTVRSCISSSPAVATVALIDGNVCRVTAVAEGATTITATSSGGVTGSALLTVTAAQSALTALAVSPASAVVIVGDSLNLVTVPTAPTGVAVTYQYTSSNNTVATVTTNGRVVGLAPGTAVITVIGSGAGGGYTANSITRTVDVNVQTGATGVSGLQVNPTTINMARGATQTLTAVANQPADAPRATISFGSNAPSVATVSQTGVVTALSPGSATITVTATSPRGFGFAASTQSQLVGVTVTEGGQDGVSLLQVTPGTLSLTQNAAQPLSVTLVQPQGAPTAQVTYATSASAVATVSANGIVQGVAPGSATITVTATSPAGGVYRATTLSQQLQVTVSNAAAGITAISVVPASANLSVGEGRAITVVPTQPAGAPAATYEFTSSSSAIASVSANGLISAVAPGTATITVTARSAANGSYAAGQLSQAIPVTVVARVAGITGVTLSPTTTALSAGARDTLVATVNQPAGAPSPTISFESSAPNIASVSASGVVTAVSSGSAVITVRASSPGTSAFLPSTVAATATVTVTTPGIVTFGFSPSSIALATGAQQVLAPTITQPDGAPGVVYSYTSNAPAVVAVNSATGVITAVAVGSATITATATTTATALFAATSRTATLLVTVTSGTPSIASLTVTPSPLSLIEGASQTLGVSIGAPPQAPAASVTYQSLNPSVASVTAAGLVTAIAPGATSISVTATAPAAGAFAASTQTQFVAVTITPKPAGISTFLVTPSSVAVSQGATRQLTTDLTQPNGAPTAAITWQSANPSVATVSASGVVTALSIGTTNISVTASTSGTTGFSASSIMRTVVVTVTAAPDGITSLTISPTSASVFVNATTQLSASVQQPVGAPTAVVTYSSSAPAVATVNASGLVTAVSAGSATITVTASNAAGGGFAASNRVQQVSMTVTVAPSAITSVTVTPSSATLAVSATSQLAPTVVQPPGAPSASVTYVSSAPGVATVNASGVVTAVSVGSATIVVTATAGGSANFSAAAVPRNVPITVTSAPAGITSLTASPTSISALVGATRQVTPTVQQPVGAPAASVTYASSASAVATVNTSGLVTAVGAGSATITVTASSPGGNGFAATSVTQLIAVAVTTPQPGISAVSATPNPVSVARRATTLLTATTTRPVGAPAATVTYASSNPAVATVNTSGLITGVAVGSAIVTVTASTPAAAGFTAASVQTTVPVSVYYQDQFNSLSAWSNNGEGSWTLVNGQLQGEYDITCGAPNCAQADLILADSLQPVQTTWRAEVKFYAVTRFWGTGYNLATAVANFAMYTSNSVKFSTSIGRAANLSTNPGGFPSTATNVEYAMQPYPWVSQFSGTVSTSPWQTAGPNTAAIERDGNTYKLYLNDELVTTFSWTLSGSPRIALHTYGMILLDDFKIFGK